MTERQIRIGMLVEPSEDHRRQFRYNKIKRGRGKIVGMSRYSECWRVKWDGLRAVETLHEKFLSSFGEYAPPSEDGK